MIPSIFSFNFEVKVYITRTSYISNNYNKILNFLKTWIKFLIAMSALKVLH